MVKNKSLEESFIDAMFTLEDEAEVEESYPVLKEGMTIICRDNIQSPYDYITKYIFEHEEINNPEEVVLPFVTLKELYVRRDGENGDDIFVFLNSIERHIRLAIIQQEYIKKNSEEALRISEKAEQKIKTLENNIKDAEKKLKVAENQIDKMEKVKGSIYTEFIAILGIFSALIFGLFGGFDGLSKAIVSLSSEWSMGKVLIISSGIMLCLTLLIFGLLQWVARITDRKLTSCDCYKKGEECKHSMFQRHRTLFSLVLSFIFVFLIGEYIESYESIAGINSFQEVHPQVFTFLAWVIPILSVGLIVFVLYKIFKKPEN